MSYRPDAFTNTLIGIHAKERHQCHTIDCNDGTVHTSNDGARSWLVTKSPSVSQEKPNDDCPTFPTGEVITSSALDGGRRGWQAAECEQETENRLVWQLEQCWTLPLIQPDMAFGGIT